MKIIILYTLIFFIIEIFVVGIILFTQSTVFQTSRDYVMVHEEIESLQSSEVRLVLMETMNIEDLKIGDQIILKTVIDQVTHYSIETVASTSTNDEITYLSDDGRFHEVTNEQRIEGLFVKELNTMDRFFYTITYFEGFFLLLVIQVSMVTLGVAIFKKRYQSNQEFINTLHK